MHTKTKTMKVISLLLLSCSIHAASMEQFLKAMAFVESSNNPQAENKSEKALGLYQIRPAYLTDTHLPFHHKDMVNPQKARAVVLAYFKRYEPSALERKDFETLARLHNAGPGWRKRMQSTNNYWKKIQKNIK
jgi:soluble lytic murein transglycosylase-like protein